MFENIDLQIADDKKTEAAAGLRGPVFSQFYACTRTGCWGTSCKYPC